MGGVTADNKSEELLSAVSEVLSQIRRSKTEAKTSQRTAIAHLKISATTTQLQLIDSCMHDLCNAGGLSRVDMVAHDNDAIAVQVLPALTT